MQALPGPSVQWALLATVATICLLKGLLWGGPATPPVEPKSKKAKGQAVPASKAPAGPPAARAPAVERKRK